MTKGKAIKLLVNATYSDEWQGNEDLTTAHNMAIKALEQQKTGHWVKEYIGCMYDVCSECGQKITAGYFEYEYCPNCGAKMAESEG